MASRRNPVRRAHIVGWGMAVPERVLTNDEIAATVDTSDEWIRQRTGIVERHIVADGETTFSLGLRASRAALEVADQDPAHLDLIVVSTVTPEYSMPATACLIQDALGAESAAAFDLSAGCSGFVYALSVAADMIAAGTYERALVVGAETLSRITDWTDRGTCILFGDGAGAVVLHANGASGGVLSSVLGSDGSGADLLIVPGGGSALPASVETVSQRKHCVQMQGNQVFRFATRVLPEACREVLQRAGAAIEDVRLFIPHQANDRILQAAAKGLGVAQERMFSNLTRYGNTSTASIPIALCEAVERGMIERDDLIVFAGFGAGLTWAAAAVRWSVPLPALPPTRRTAFWRSLRYRWARHRSWWRRVWRKIDVRLFHVMYDEDGRKKYGRKDES